MSRMKVKVSERIQTMEKIGIFGVFLAALLTQISLASARPIRGFYEVPVKDPSLRQYAVYPVRYQPDMYEDVPTKMEFPLPAVLVGEQTFVQMEKVSQTSNTWTGPNVRGECKKEDRYFVCAVKFNDLNINPQKVISEIDANYSLPEEVTGRTAVAQFFEGQPIGIIRYRLRGRDRN